MERNEDNMMEYHRASDMNELWQRLTLQAVSAPENDLIWANAVFGSEGVERAIEGSCNNLTCQTCIFQVQAITNLEVQNRPCT